MVITGAQQAGPCLLLEAMLHRPRLPFLPQVLGGSAAPGSKDMSDAEWEHEIAVLRACRNTHVIQFQVRCSGWHVENSGAARVYATAGVRQIGWFLR